MSSDAVDIVETLAAALFHEPEPEVTPPAPINTPTEFLETLLPNSVDYQKGSVAALWTYPDRRTHQFSPDDHTGILATSTAYTAKGEHVYLHLATHFTNKIGPGGRGSDEAAAALLVLADEWDILLPGHKHASNNLPKTLDEALAFLKELPIGPPTVVIHSGYGVYPFWIFKEPLILDEGGRIIAEELLKRYMQCRDTLGKKHGFAFDKVTSSVAAVLRLPGSKNFKQPEAQDVKIIASNPTALYNPTDLLDRRPAPVEVYVPPVGKPLEGDELNRQVQGLVVSYMRKAAAGLGRNKAGFSLAQQLRDAGLTAEHALAKGAEYIKFCQASWPDRAYGRAEYKESVRQAFKKPPRAPLPAMAKEPRPTPRDEPRKEGDARPEIVLTGGELSETISASESALIADTAGVRIYQRGSELVRVARLEAKKFEDGITRQKGSLVIVPVGDFYLTERLTQAARWIRKETQYIGDAPITTSHAVDCPKRIAQSLLERVGLWNLPPLAGIIETPTLRPDGSILDKPGYDEKTGILYEPGDSKFPAISEAPTREDAEATMRFLLEVVKGFPFVDEVSRAAAVCEILTPLVRRSLRSAPLFANSAPTMGTGKSLIADVASLIALNHRASAMTQAPNDTEDQKRWLTVLRSGDLIVLIDNISRPLASDALNAILTGETYKSRLLGASKDITASTAVSLMATGNNLTIEGDLRTRVIPVDMDARMEHPEARKFDVDLLSWVPQHRGALVRAGLTILRAYCVAGYPNRPPPFGRFEQWSDWVRGAVMWLGLHDPHLGCAKLDARDPVESNLNALLTHWYAGFGERRVTAAEVVREAKQENSGNAELLAVLAEFADDQKGGINTKSLGHTFRKFDGRISGGLCLSKVDERSGVALWQVQ